MTIGHATTMQALTGGRYTLGFGRGVNKQFDLGVDGVIMHGATPEELAPVVSAYRGIRSPALHAGLPRNPGAARLR